MSPVVRRPVHPLVHRAGVALASAVGCLLLTSAAGLPAGQAAAGVGTGDTVWPLSPRPPVVRPFLPPPKRWLPGHRGVDLLGMPGQSVRSAAAGTVTYAGVLAGRGVVVVSHGATRTTYEPVLSAVRAGVEVPAGAVVGTLSAAGSHCAPRACLHWGLLRGQTYVDPLSMLGGAPIRLLPNGREASTPGGEVPPGAVPVVPAVRAGPPRGQTATAEPSDIAVGGVAAGGVTAVALGAGLLASRRRARGPGRHG